MKELERRTIEGKLELRAVEGKPEALRGYAVVYNSLSSDLGGFLERVIPGACKNSLAGGQDIRALVDHDMSRLLGRTSAGTLRVGEDETGLWFEVELPDTSYAADLRALVARGDVAGCSFGFYVMPDGERWLPSANGDGRPIRELTNIDVREVTVTSCPAYEGTSVSLRVDPEAVIRCSAAIPQPEVFTNHGLLVDLDRTKFLNK